MKTRADIIDKLEDKYKITAESLTDRELLIIGIATGDHDSEVEKLFIPVVSNCNHTYTTHGVQWDNWQECSKCGHVK